MARIDRAEGLWLKLGRAAAMGGLVLAAVVVIAVVWPSRSGREGGGGPGTERPAWVTVELAGRPFRMELAVTAEQVRHGLMGRAGLAEQTGMLFVFADEQVRQFWMANCLMDLDIVFLDGQGRVVSIHSLPAPSPGAEPAYCLSAAPAQFAIEVAAGTAGRLGLKVGDRVSMDLEGLKRLAR